MPSPGAGEAGVRQSRQIPVVYEGRAPYSRPQSASRLREEPGPGRPQSSTRRMVMEDPFFNRASFYNDPLFGW